MRALLIARKMLTEMVREPMQAVILFVAPLAFLIMTGVAYSYPIMKTYPIIVDVSDPEGASLVQYLQEQRYNNGHSQFTIKRISNSDQIREELEHRQSTVSIKLLTSQNDKPSFTIEGDALYTDFYQAATLLQNATDSYFAEHGLQKIPYKLFEQSFTTRGPITAFDLYMPGMIIFALMMLVPNTAILIAREVRWKTLNRLQMTRMSGWDLLAGVTMAQFLVAIVLTFLIFGVSLLLGFNNQGSIWLALLCSIITSLSAIGTGLIVGSFTKNDSDAANIGAASGLFQVMLAGAFFPLPSPTLFTFNGHQMGIFDLIPATHSNLAMQNVLSYGMGWNDIVFRVVATLLVSLLYFGAGIVIFRVRHRSR
jgi:ABC-2 type transport system permease protein